MIHTVKGFSLVNEAEVDAFLEFSCFFNDPTDGSLISGSSAFSKSSLNIWNFSVHVLLKPSLEKFEHYFSSVWDECNCSVVWTFFGIAVLWHNLCHNIKVPKSGKILRRTILTFFFISIWVMLLPLTYIIYVQENENYKWIVYWKEVRWPPRKDCSFTGKHF